MGKHQSVILPEDLRKLQEKWVQAERGVQDVIYSKEFGPAFIPLFAKLPMEGAAEDDHPRFKALITVLGLSWQPIALMAAWAKPERILVLGTDESLSMEVADEPVLDVISRLSGISLSQFKAQRVADSGELDIYREVRAFVSHYGFGPHEIVVDPTGGKKSMSASAALAGFLTGAWIVYVDYAQYQKEKRIPVAGTEYPRLLRNALDVFGDLEFERIKEAYRGGSYEVAWDLAQSLSHRLYEPREAEALELLSRGYGAWHQFNFEDARLFLEKLKAHMDKFSTFGRWQWSTDIFEIVKHQAGTIGALAALSKKANAGSRLETLEEGLPLVLNHIAAAERELENHHVGAAMLLTYATLERFVDLALWVCWGLDDEKPDFSRLKLDGEAFDRTGRELHKKKYERRALQGPIGLALGVQLLATLSPGLLAKHHFGPIHGLMADRNKCEYEHGLCARPLGEGQVKNHIQAVKKVLDEALTPYGKTLENELAYYRFPRIK